MITTWCDAKHPTEPERYCTCSKTPGHSDVHKCWGCGREWPNTPVLLVMEERSEISPDVFREISS